MEIVWIVLTSVAAVILGTITFVIARHNKETFTINLSVAILLVTSGILLIPSVPTSFLLWLGLIAGAVGFIASAGVMNSSKRFGTLERNVYQTAIFALGLGLYIGSGIFYDPITALKFFGCQLLGLIIGFMASLIVVAILTTINSNRYHQPTN